MSYKVQSFENRSRWGADNCDIKQYLGLKPYEKLPRTELGPVIVPLTDGRTTLLWLTAFVPAPDWNGRPQKTSKHRTFTHCPDCGSTVPAGRTHQHKCQYNLVEALTAIQAFKPKSVQGLYSYNHYERSDGAWFQVSVDRTRQQVTYCASDKSPLMRFPDLKHFGIYLSNGGK